MYRSTRCILVQFEIEIGREPTCRRWGDPGGPQLSDCSPLQGHTLSLTRSASALGPAASLTHSLRSLSSHSGLASVCLLACSSDERRDARRPATPRLPRRFPGRHGNRPFPPDRPRSLHTALLRLRNRFSSRAMFRTTWNKIDRRFFYLFGDMRRCLRTSS